MNLLALNDISQVEYLLKQHADLLASHRLMTQDLTVAHELERRGIDFLDEFSFLSPADIEENWNQANELGAVWQHHAFPGVGEGLELASLAQQEWVWPFEICLNARTAYRHMLDACSVESVCGYWLPPQPVLRTGPASARAMASLAQAVLRWMVEQERIPVHSLQCHRPPSIERQKWRRHRPPVAVPAGKRPVPGQKRVIVMVETGLRAHEQAVLEQYLESQTDSCLVRISPWELGPHGLFAASIGTTEFDAALQGARTDLAKNRQAYGGPYPEIFANQHLEFQFLRILDEIQIAARVGVAFGAMLDVLRPSLLIVGHDAFARERMLVRQAQARGVPTVALIHGGLRHSMGARGIVGLSDHILVWGEEDRRFLERYGVASARIHEVGSLQYAERYSQVGSTHPAGQKSAQRAAAKQRLSLPAERAVVVFLTATVYSGFAQILANPSQHRKTWADLAQLAARRPDLAFAIKPHPNYDHFEFYRQLTSRTSKNLVFLESVSLEDALAAADVVVLVNYGTTAALEAMLAEIPVVFLREAILPLESREDSLRNHGAVPAASVGELESILDRLLQDQEACAAATEDAKQVMPRLLGEKDQPVMPRIAAFLKSVSSSSPPAVNHRLRAGDKCSIGVSEVASLLWRGAGERAYLDALRDLHRPAGDDPRLDFWNEANLFALAYSLGLCAENASALLTLATKSLAAMASAQPVTAPARQQFLLMAFSAALIRAVSTGQRRGSQSYARVILGRMPGAVARSPLFRRCLAECLVGSSRCWLTLASLVTGICSKWAPLQRTRYQKIG